MSARYEGKDEIEFSSGRKVYVNCGIVGIGPDLALYEGYDGYLAGVPGSNEEKYAADLRELAELAMDRWRRLLEGLG